MKARLISLLGYACILMAAIFSSSGIFILFVKWELADQLAVGISPDDAEYQKLQEFQAKVEQSSLDFNLKYGPFRDVENVTTKEALTRCVLNRDKREYKENQAIFSLFLSQIFMIMGFLVLRLNKVTVVTPPILETEKV